jgi:MFS family permease
MISDTLKKSISPTFAALQEPNYRLWFFGQMVSLIGTWMQSTAQGYLIYSLTGSAASLGIISFISGVPTWVFTLYGGVISDRIARRTLLILTQIAMMLLALIMAALVFTNLIQPWHIGVLAFLLGVTNAFDAPTRLSFIRELVSRENMTNAIALNATMFNIGTIIGPAIGGLTYAAFGPGWCFSINGISFLAVIFNLSRMRIERQIIPPTSKSAIHELKEGIRYVWNHRVIRAIIINVGAVSLFGFGLVALLPAWAVAILHGDVTTNGWLLSARGAGSLIGALILASLGTRKIRGKLWAISHLLVPVFWIVFSWITRLSLSLIAIGVVGLFIIMMVNLSNAMVQMQVDDALRGRVMGIYTMIFFGLTPVGSLLAGLLSEKIGEQWTVTISGIVLLFVAVFTWVKMPYLRELE